LDKLQLNNYCKFLSITNMKLFTVFILSTLTAMVFTSCTQQRPDYMKIRIIETSDVHGALFPVDFLNDNQPIASLANITTYIKKQQQKKGLELVLLDNGDFLQGDPSVYYSNFIDTTSRHICADIFNYLHYDAVCIGNHDIEPGHSVYDKLVREMQMPLLGANAVNDSTGEPYFTPYKIITRQGVKIAVLGLITPAIPNWLPEKLWEGMHFEDMILSARKWVKIIQEQENPDLLIGLFHAGIDYSYNGQHEASEKNENASQLVAELVPGFDVILVGHDHHGWNKTILNRQNKEVLLLGPTSRARDIAVVDIELFYNPANDTYDKEISGNLFSMTDQEPDPEYMKKFGYFKKNTQAYVSEPIGEFTRDIDSKPALFGNAEFTDLIHQLQLDLTDADISFTSPLSFNTTIAKGKIFVKDLFKLYRFENLLYTMKLTGSEIHTFLEYSYGNWFGQMYSEEDHLLNYKRDEFGKIARADNNGRALLAGQYFNYAAAAGLDYTVDITKPAGERVEILQMSNGKPFDRNKIYRVAMNSYRGNGGGGHLTKGAGIPEQELPARMIFTTEKDLRYYLHQWLTKNSPVTPTRFNNWKVIPENLAEKGKQNDIQLLFGNNYPFE